MLSFWLIKGIAFLFRFMLNQGLYIQLFLFQTVKPQVETEEKPTEIHTVTSPAPPKPKREENPQVPIVKILFSGK